MENQRLKSKLYGSSLFHYVGCNRRPFLGTWHHLGTLQLVQSQPSQVQRRACVD